METTPRRGWRRTARRLLVGGFLVSVAVAVAVALTGQDWSAVASATVGRQPALFGLLVGCAFVANSVALLLSLASWRAMLVGVGERVSGMAAARIYFVGVFAKFVPGKVLGFVTSIQMGKAIGIPPSRIVSAWLLALAVLLQTGLTLGLLAGPDVFGGSAAWLALAVLPIVGVMVRPNLVNRMAAGGARLLRRSPPATVSGREIRIAIAAQSLSWLCAGLHLWVLAVAFGAEPLRSLLLCVGAFSLASVLGLLAVFTPEGLGVREVILMVALSAVLALPAATAVVLVSRLVFTLSEVTTAGVGLLVTQIARRRQHEQPPGPEPTAQHVTGKVRRPCPN